MVFGLTPCTPVIIFSWFAPNTTWCLVHTNIRPPFTTWCLVHTKSVPPDWNDDGQKFDRCGVTESGKKVVAGGGGGQKDVELGVC